jgi:hypothetical protein
MCGQLLTALRTDAFRRSRNACLALVTAILSLALCATAFAASSSMALHGPNSNLLGTSFKYTASGVAGGPANFVYGWEAPAGVPCAGTYGVESERSGIFLFVSRAVSKNARYSLTVNFLARNTESHRFCAYLVNKSTHKTYAHAGAFWTNHRASTAPTTAGLQPTPVASGQR